MGAKNVVKSDIHFLNYTCDIEENKRQRYARLPFLKIGGPHQRVPT